LPQANLLMDVKQIERKIRFLQRQLQKNDHVRSRLDTYVQLADLYQKLGAFEDQIEWLTRAYGVLKRRRTPSEIRFNVLMSFIAAYRIFESEKAYSLGLKFADLALVEATALQNHAFEQKARHQKAFYLISYSSENESNLNDAEVLLQRMVSEGHAHQNKPDFRYIAYVHLGIINRYRENIREAKKYFDLTIENLPEDISEQSRASVYKSVAKFQLYGLQNLQRAKEWLEKAVNMKTPAFNKHAIYQDLEFIAKEEGDFAKAYEMLQKRVELEREWNMEKAETKMTAMKVRSDLLDAKRKRKIFELENVKLAEANRKIAEKNKHITDSITYSSRLQNAVLPTEDELREAFGDHFIFYRPKDIVAGDFYWFQKTANYYYFAVADCTGHGVPGAMVSMICHNALTESVQKLNEPDTNTILENARSLVKLFFNSDSNNIKDGMDIAIIRFGITDRGQVQFSGAHNPLLQLKANGELLVHKADRQPVGSWVKEVPFTAINLELEPTDVIYLHSDGYPDQFGGPDATKLKTKGFRQLLADTCSERLEVQHEAIARFFTEWCTNEEQMDDVTVAGLRLLP
jgi:serine phosphatase RsbU (regulator of sigma subunit)